MRDRTFVQREALFSVVPLHQELYDLCDLETALRTRTCSKYMLAPMALNRVVVRGLVQGFRHAEWKQRCDAAKRLDKLGKYIETADCLNRLGKPLRMPPTIRVRGDRHLVAAMLSAFPEEADKEVDDDAYDFHLDVLNTISLASARGDASVCAKLVLQVRENDCPILRAAALSALADVGCQGDIAAVAAAQGCIEDDDDDLRVEATTALGALSNHGDQHVAATLARRLDIDSASEVRLQAVQALKDKSVDDSAIVVGSLSRRVREDENKEVRLEAVSALRTVAAARNAVAVSSLSNVIGNEVDSEVQLEALDAIRFIAGRGDERVCKACLACLSSESYDIRCAAADAIGSIAAKGDSDVLQGIIVGLCRPQPKCVFQALLQAIGKIAETGDRLAVSVLGKLVLDDTIERDLRRDVARALEGVASKGDPFVMAVLAGCLSSKNRSTQNIGVETLYCFVDSMERSDMSWVPVVAAHANAADKYVAKLCRSMLAEYRIDSDADQSDD